jgi:LPXTG-motif cell wall-anchored protein
LWTAFRPDTSTPCPAVDPATFTGPDTNSTALAVLGLHAQGVSSGVASALSALAGVRNAGGGWGDLARADQATDANSTGLVLDAIFSVDGAADPKGISALLQLQVGCDAATADQGGIAFQPGAGGALVPDQMATVQATPALAEVALPIVAPEIGTGLAEPCAPVGSAGSTTSIAVSESGASSTTTFFVSAAELPSTGSTDTEPVIIVALVLLVAGSAFVLATRRCSTRGQPRDASRTR